MGISGGATPGVAQKICRRGKMGRIGQAASTVWLRASFPLTPPGKIPVVSPRRPSSFYLGVHLLRVVNAKVTRRFGLGWRPLHPSPFNTANSRIHSPLTSSLPPGRKRRLGGVRPSCYAGNVRFFFFGCVFPIHFELTAPLPLPPRARFRT